MGALLFISVYSILAFGLGVYAHATRSYHHMKSWATQGVALFPNMLRGLRAKPERITIDIKQKDFMKLAEKRQAALEQQLLFSSPDDYVPGKIRYGDQTLDVKLRLKGDLADHWGGDKWSLRIVIRKNQILFGMKEFSIQAPERRNYIYEWLFHRALKRERLPSLRYDFIDVTLNGKHKGIYALEEHFDKRLIESNRQREGPIVRLSESSFWSQRPLASVGIEGHQVLRETTGTDSYLTAEVDGFQTRQWLSAGETREQYVQASRLLDSFRRGEAKAEQVFDLQKLATFFAISDLMGARHATLWNNLRFYYNPITSRLEPIGYDAYQNEWQPIAMSLTAALPHLEYGSTNYGRWGWASLPFLAKLFDDIPFTEEYLRQLERIASAGYIDTFFAEVDADLQRALDIIYSEYPNFHFDKKAYYHNQWYIRQQLNPPKGLQAYFAGSSSNSVDLEVGNMLYLPVEVLGLSRGGRALAQLKERLILAGRNRYEPVALQKIRFSLPASVSAADLVPADVRIDYRILGTQAVRQEGISPVLLRSAFASTDLVRARSNISQFKFLVVDSSARRIQIEPGTWEVKQSLVIPAGFRVVAGPGVQLNFTNSAVMVSHSPLELIGSPEDPIVLQSADSTGQGLVVLQAGEPSLLQDVIFKNLSNPSHNGWRLTGAVTFYESPVQMSHCQFLQSRAEDSLNLVRSDFVIDRSLFKESASDALDVDFGKGKITDSSFFGSKNDAIDISGSTVESSNILIDGAGDKGLSVGENSWLRMEGVRIRNARVAVASKDLSRSDLSRVEITDSQIGLAAFRKKAEFGPGSIRVNGIVLRQVQTPYLIEENSKVNVDGHTMLGDRKGVKEIVYGEQDE